MELITEQQIFEILKTKSDSGSFDFPDTIQEDVKEFLNGLDNSLTIKTEISGFERNLTGKNLASWINPLHFEKNLNSAMDSLEATEFILKEHREINLIKLQLNFIGSQLSDNVSAINLHRELSSKLTLNRFQENINLRLSKKIVDLIEYTKAAKLGAKILFGIEEEEIEYTGTLTGVGKIRESLRSLLVKFREIKKYDQEIIIPISLKRSKNDSGNRLVEKWTEVETERKPEHELKQDTLEFDLSLFDDVKSLDFQRLRRVGIQIIDKRSQTGAKADGETEDKVHHNYWDVTLTDEDNGYKLGSSALAQSLQLNPILYKNVQAGKGNYAVQWSNYNTLINFNADRKWKLSINKKSHIDVDFKEIRDIVIHFHLAFNKRPV